MSERKPPIVAGLQTERLALIGLRWNKSFPELVIAHCGGESLSKLIAAPDIVGIALVRREEAVTGIRGNSSGAADSKELQIMFAGMETAAANFNPRAFPCDTDWVLVKSAAWRPQLYSEVSRQGS